MLHFFMFFLELAFKQTQCVFEACEAYIHLSLNSMYPVMWFGEWEEWWSPSDHQAQDTHSKKIMKSINLKLQCVFIL